MPHRAHGEIEAAGDQLAAYLATVPRGLSAAAWARWRAKNPPPYLRAENRRGDHCGVCGGELAGGSHFCLACHRRELGEGWQEFFERAALPDPCATDGCGGRRVLGSDMCARCSYIAKQPVEDLEEPA
jgi:hypothetical protein